MGLNADVDELARNLEESLKLGDRQQIPETQHLPQGPETQHLPQGPETQHLPQGPESTADNRASKEDAAAASNDNSDTESMFSVPSSEYSSPESDSQESSVGVAPWRPLSIHKPTLPAGKESLFAGAASPFDSIARMMKAGKARRIVVMAGAGISTDAGIPDFRTPGTGLYANLQEYGLPYPEAIFTIDYFQKKPKPFFVLAKELYPGQFTPTVSHFFVKLLEQKGLLLRHYTQNIDCLERVAGVGSDLIVEAHGSFHAAHCIDKACRKAFGQDWLREQIFDDKIPRCDQCQALIKPDITFFGEGLPSRFFELLEDDFAACDLLLVMGTSLTVQPFASLINEVRDSVPRLLINRERVGESRTRGSGFDFDGFLRNGPPHRDALVLGDCDEACLLLAERLGWKDELLKLRAGFVAGT
ncbi:NAD-dependent protein deacetylase sirtuin-2 [Coemansia sp. RSA 552]|nr:NAD-dependent protein deacetylase sirtuin-2 [Coemansia sp. RSA 552]